MQLVWESIELMIFVYGLAAVVSYAVAALLKMFHSLIEKNKARAAAAKPAPGGAD